MYVRQPFAKSSLILLPLKTHFPFEGAAFEAFATLSSSQLPSRLALDSGLSSQVISNEPGIGFKIFIVFSPITCFSSQETAFTEITLSSVMFAAFKRPVGEIFATDSSETSQVKFLLVG